MSGRRSLEGQVIVVTGAARGVGELLARKLSARGAKLALVGLEPDELKKVSERLHSESDHWFADVTDHEAMARVAQEVKQRFGKIDVVVANAGVAAGGPFVDSDPDAWRRVIEVNLIGGAVTGRAFLPVLMESRGYFLQIASLAAMTPAADDDRVLRVQVGRGGVRAQPAGRGRPPGREGRGRLPVLDRHGHGAGRRPGRRDAGTAPAAALAA